MHTYYIRKMNNKNIQYNEHNKNNRQNKINNWKESYFKVFNFGNNKRLKGRISMNYVKGFTGGNRN